MALPDVALPIAPMHWCGLTGAGYSDKSMGIALFRFHRFGQRLRNSQADGARTSYGGVRRH
jgi:hypothetical protein